MSAIGQTGTVAATPSATPEGAPTSTGQAPQPTEQGQQQNNGFWGRFPTVPEEQRAALEPHLKSVQAYVTRLEQSMAPFKGYTPQQAQGLANFAKAFDANPLQVFVAIAQDLQTKGVIHADLDLDALRAVIQGQEYTPVDDEPTSPGPGNGADPWADAPPWAHEMRSWKEAQEQQTQEQQRAVQEQREDAVLDSQIATIKGKLKADGWPKEYLDNPGLEKDLIARFLVHQGSSERVLGELSTLRTSLLQGLVKPEDDNSVELNNGVPRVGTATSRRAKQRPGDSFAQASAGAEQHLRAALRSQQTNG